MSEQNEKRFMVIKPIKYQRDIGNAEVGDIAVKEGSSYKFNGISYSAETVENSPEWFEEILTVDGLPHLLSWENGKPVYKLFICDLRDLKSEEIYRHGAT